MAAIGIKLKCSIGIVTGLLFVTSCSEDREFITIEKSDIVESVYSSVVVEPHEMYNVNASIPGYINEVKVEVGDEVDMNDLLFRIRDIQSFNTANNAKLAYEIALRNYNGEENLIQDLRLERENVRLKRKNDSINYSKNKILFEKGLINEIEYDQSQLVFEASKNNFESLQNRIVRTERELKASMLQAKNNYNSSQSRFDESMVLCKMEGRVYDVFKEEGEYVMMQEPIAIVGSKDSFKINMLIDEIDITKVRLRQKIIVSLEAYEDTAFIAYVTRISPKMDPRTQTFKIEGVFKIAPEKLYMGLTGEGNIIIRERMDVVVIPREYMIDDNKVETDGGVIRVTTGTKSLSHIEIVSGLKVGDVIYKPI